MKKILPWIAMIWGGLVFLKGVPALLATEGTVSAYGAGQMGATVFGLFLFVAGLYSILKGKTDEE